MQQKIYAIYDKIAGEYGPPFCAKNDEVAKRQFSHLVRQQDLALGEFELWMLGSFDTEKGITDVQHNVVFLFSQEQIAKGDIDAETV